MNRLFASATVALGLALGACGSGGGNTQNDAAAATTKGGDGWDALEDAEGTGTAARLLKTAKLDRILEGHGSYTIFAPSDEAFAALPEEQRKAIEQADARPQLVALLRQHVAPGYVTVVDINKALAGGTAEIASMGAAPIRIRKEGDTILLGQGENAARIVGTPVSLGNSIAYRIDRILPPPAG